MVIVVSRVEPMRLRPWVGSDFCLVSFDPFGCEPLEVESFEPPMRTPGFLGDYHRNRRWITMATGRARRSAMESWGSKPGDGLQAFKRWCS